MCSKHVEARNKTCCETKFGASSWLNTEINIVTCTASKTSKTKNFFFPSEQEIRGTNSKSTSELSVCFLSRHANSYEAATTSQIGQSHVIRSAPNALFSCIQLSHGWLKFYFQHLTVFWGRFRMPYPRMRISYHTLEPYANKKID